MSKALYARAEPANDGQTVTEMRRAQFVEAAIRLFSQRGYFNTSIEDVADDVQVSKGLFYRYFTDKNDLLFYCLVYLFDQYKIDELPARIAEVGPLKSLIDLITMHCNHSSRHILEVVLAYKSMSDLTVEQRGKIKILETKIARMFRKCIDACVANGTMKEVNSDIIAYQCIMLSHGWALKNWAFRDLCTFEEYLSEFINMLVRSLLTECGLEEFRRLQDDL